MKTLRLCSQLISRQFGSVQKAELSAKRWNHIAATLKKFGEPLELIEEKDGSVGPYEVEVSVDSAGVNTADVQMTQNLHHIKPILPAVPGFELAGEVKSIGVNVRNFKVGDRVLGFKRKGTGAFAQSCILDEDELFSIPYSLKYEQAASIPVAYGSAFLAFKKISGLAEGANVLVIGSNGSTALAAIDLAQNYFRCKVIAATETEAKCAVVRPLGVLATVEYTDENLVKSVRKATDGRGVDVVIDTVGGQWFNMALKSMAPGGHMCSLGFSSGKSPMLNVQELISNRVTVSGIWLGGYAEENPKHFREIIENIIKFRDKGYISPHPAKCYPLDKVNEALFSPEAKDTLGKVVLKLTT